MAGLFEGVAARTFARCCSAPRSRRCSSITDWKKSVRMRVRVAVGRHHARRAARPDQRPAASVGSSPGGNCWGALRRLGILTQGRRHRAAHSSCSGRSYLFGQKALAPWPGVSSTISCSFLVCAALISRRAGHVFARPRHRVQSRDRQILTARRAGRRGGITDGGPFTALASAPPVTLPHRGGRVRRLLDFGSGHGCSLAAWPPAGSCATSASPS